MTPPAPTRRTLGQSATRAVLATARVADRLPLAPKDLGRRARDAKRRRVQVMAARKNLRYRELLAREAPGGFVDYDDWLERMRIEDQLGPGPTWLDAASRLHQVSAETAARFAVRVVQRTRRGWSDEDLWSLGDTLRRTLGAQLVALATQTNEAPADGQWGQRGEQWVQALRHHGEVLGTYPRGLNREEQEANREEVRASLHWVAVHFEHLGW